MFTSTEVYIYQNSLPTLSILKLSGKKKELCDEIIIGEIVEVTEQCCSKNTSFFPVKYTNVTER